VASQAAVLVFPDCQEGDNGFERKTKLGIALAVAVLAGLTSVWLSVLLLMLAGFLIVWGLSPERTEEFIRELPFAQSPPKGNGSIRLHHLAVRNVEPGSGPVNGLN
jgi:hypothetical protein